MQLSILAVNLLATLALTVSLPGSLAPDAISQCEAAPNCETYIDGGKTLIRFKPGMGPGSDDYQSRFGSNSSSSSSSSTSRLAKGGITTKVQMGDTSMNFGTTAPDGTGGVYHHLYDICHESTCDPSGVQVDSQTIANFRGNSYPETFQLTLSATGQYDGWKERNNYVDAMVAAAGKGVSWTTKRWCIRMKEGDDCGSLKQAEQTSFINVARYKSGNLRGFLTAQVSVQSGDGGWCGKIAGIFTSIAGAIDPIAGGFFGVASAACQ
ncbi:hypothetical protein APHAL10511_000563 [Amanita phalloides]|nr:hypothetical protein APHAL10511_000563 [Amanita phalloides]